MIYSELNKILKQKIEEQSSSLTTGLERFGRRIERAQAEGKLSGLHLVKTRFADNADHFFTLWAGSHRGR